MKSNTLRRTVLTIALRFQSLLSKISQQISKSDKQEVQQFGRHVLALK